MSSAYSQPGSLNTMEVLADLEVGRSRPPRPVDRLTALRALPRPTLGGRRFVATYLTARALGRIHPRLARRLLLRLWFTPWPHPSALQAVHDLPDDLVAWSLPVGDRTLAGYAGGTGPTVVLAHGWAGRAADWRHLAHDLIAAGWRIVAPDLPAHGLTPGDRTDLFDLAHALASVLDHEQPSVVIAHSMGFPTTMLALEAGAVAPDTLVALAPGRKMSHAVTAFGRRARLRPALVAELVRGMEARFGVDVWDVLDVDRAVTELAISGVVIHDADDDEVPMSDALAIAERWPGARLIATEGLGHRRILRDASVRAAIVDSLG